MSEFQLKTPVAFIIFNRPDTTERVFAEIAKAKPRKLLVVGDGARTNRPGEAEKVASARAIIERVDWDCEVLTNFSDVNLGCRRRPVTGIDWVFDQVSEAIILEDDCLPHPTFFRFCEEMLERYRDDERIGMVSGDNFQFGQKRTNASYYFSRYNHIWGWASWRRAWNHYDEKAGSWNSFRDDGWLDGLGLKQRERQFWINIFQAIQEERLNTCWDYQWLLTLWSQGMLSINPNVNLISNIGFGPSATHTLGTSIYANIGVEPMEFPLCHAEIVLAHREADEFTADGMFTISWKRQLLLKIRSFLL